MYAKSSSAYPRSRTITHPGPFNPVRFQSRQASRARHLRLVIQPGRSLFEGLVEPLLQLGIESASTTLLGGTLQRVEYCTATPEPSGKSVVYYNAPIAAGHSFLIFGNATLGKDAKGLPIVHCHAAFRDPSGALKGGHMVTQNCVVGAEPVSVLVTSLEGFELRVAFDPETNISLIQPLDSAQQGDPL